MKITKKNHVVSAKKTYSGEMLARFYAKSFQREYLAMRKDRLDDMLVFAVRNGIQDELQDELKKEERKVQFVEKLVS